MKVRCQTKRAKVEKGRMNEAMRAETTLFLFFFYFFFEYENKRYSKFNWRACAGLDDGHIPSVFFFFFFKKKMG